MKCSVCGRSGNESPCLRCQVDIGEKKLKDALDRIGVLERRIRKKNRKIRELESWKALRPE